MSDNALEAQLASASAAIEAFSAGRLPPAGPIMCARCILGTCTHAAHIAEGSVRHGGLVPAVAWQDGETLCADCAAQEQDTPGGAVSTITLAEFLAARLDELEAAAKASEGHSLFGGSGIYVAPRADGPVTVVLPSHLAIFIALNDPAHVLADVAAKREILAAWQAAESRRPHDDAEYAHGHADGVADGLELAVRSLATAWKSHPDWRDDLE